MFLECLSQSLKIDERLILCAFRGDPDEAPPNAWRPRPWKRGAELSFSAKHNAYVTVASFGRAPDGSFRRRQDTFKAGLALMVDDVGTKVDRKLVEHMQPTGIVETSPDNYQWWYMLDQPLRDQEKFDQLIRAFIRSNLLGADPGMAGVTRVGRLPGFTNGKAKHDRFITKLIDLDPKRRFTVDALIKGFKLTLEGRRMPFGQVYDEESVANRIRMFFSAQKFLQQRGMLKRKNADPSGWQEMRCPWIDDHTNAANTGAAIREPHADNQHYGAFRCHHGHCMDKGWKELTEWISLRAEEEVN